MSWEETVLEDIATYRSDKIESVKISEVFISTENILKDRGGIEQTSYPPKADKVSSYEIDDVLVSNIRPYFKKIWFSDRNGGCSNDILVFQPNKDKVFPKFLYYSLSRGIFFDFMMAGANGTKMPRGNKKAIKKFEINLPPLPTQKKIASILSAYDDLIENNLKRIQLLEETAQRIYKEWFVDFKFPNHENTPINKETGLPEGWEKLKIGDYCSVGRGSSPRPIRDKKYFEGGSIPWVKIADATSSNIFVFNTKIHLNDYGASFSRKLPKGSLIIAASGTLGFPMFLGVEACIHDGWIYLKKLDNRLKYFQYYVFKSLTSYFYSISYGAAIQNINTGIVSNAITIMPTMEFIELFNKRIDTIFIQIENIQKQNQTLKEARGLLLPRIMNRTLEV